ncbi:hypothetical protein CRENBAI_008940 [Crenichthys baileyi]|uniref:Uncharacterized protein n=1 Tax=Crenichthys baileyi TaxID=28760 RepID=A0AAV9R8X4_9TELE
MYFYGGRSLKASDQDDGEPEEPGDPTDLFPAVSSAALKINWKLLIFQDPKRTVLFNHVLQSSPERCREHRTVNAACVQTCYQRLRSVFL